MLLCLLWISVWQHISVALTLEFCLTEFIRIFLSCFFVYGGWVGFDVYILTILCSLSEYLLMFVHFILVPMSLLNICSFERVIVNKGSYVLIFSKTMDMLIVYGDMVFVLEVMECGLALKGKSLWYRLTSSRALWKCGCF